MDKIEVLDTTLRDGTQQEGLSLGVNDKLRVAEQLDWLGVTYIEGGWPGANPKDDEFFARAKKELNLTTAKLVAFGSTRKAGINPADDQNLLKLIASGTEVVCIVGKAWDLHVTQALRTTLDEAIAMVRDSVAFLRDNNRTVLFDAEHFFDGFKANPEFSLNVLKAAEEAGAKALVLCDTNGGCLPHDVSRIVAQVVQRHGGTQIGVHCHNDTGCAVANTIVAVMSGVTHVQGCINGYGERTGNADLCAVIPNLSLKLNMETIGDDHLVRLTQAAHYIAEIANIGIKSQQPYVGSAAFAHKGGLHTSGTVRLKEAYEHVSPATVGNADRFVVSELAGRSTISLKAQELGLDLDTQVAQKVLDTLKHLEHEGYHFEAADGSLELLMRRSTGWEQDFFRLESFKVTTDWSTTDWSTTDQEKSDKGQSDSAKDQDLTSHSWLYGSKLTTKATVKVYVGGIKECIVATAEGNGPVNALDTALRKAISSQFEHLSDLRLVDYRVRVLDTHAGTAAVTRVLIDTTDGSRTWSTIGVSPNIIQASWEALVDSIVLGLLRHINERQNTDETTTGAGWTSTADRR